MAYNKDSTLVAVSNDVDSLPEKDELEILRSLLLGSQSATVQDLQIRLQTLEQRLDSPEARTSDTSEILAEAIAKRMTEDDKLGEALNPVVVEQFRATSRNDPEIMAEALFPILGPAVRKMIVNIISPDKNTKKKAYQVEQLLLIHKSTGLPVCHVAAESAATQDADMVSGMLNAIQSFVQDAFETEEFDGLDTLQLGELSVWIEWGPDAALAAVVRGMPPKKLREALQIRIEQIHSVFGTDLSVYEGDATAFDPLIPELFQFLETHDGSLKNRVLNLPAQVRKYLVAGVLVLVCACMWWGYGQYDSMRWNKHLASIEALPGIIITDQQRGFRHYSVSGLRDPLAIDPKKLLADTSIDPEYVEYRLEPYQAIHQEFVLERAKNVLQAPAGVSVSIRDTVLYLDGVKNAEWAAESKRIARSIAGISEIVVNSNTGP